MKEWLLKETGSDRSEEKDLHDWSGKNTQKKRQPPALAKKVRGARGGKSWFMSQRVKKQTRCIGGGDGGCRDNLERSVKAPGSYTWLIGRQRHTTAIKLFTCGTSRPQHGFMQMPSCAASFPWGHWHWSYFAKSFFLSEHTDLNEYKLFRTCLKRLPW